MAYRNGMVGVKMEQIVLIKKGMKKHFGTLISIIILLFLIFFSLIMAVSIYENAGKYVKREMERLEYGDITVWVSNVNNLQNLKKEIEKVSDVEKVNIQELIFAGYNVNGTHSDNEGQLLRYGDTDYYILNEDMTNYQTISEIKENEIYVSPAMLSTYDLKIGEQKRNLLLQDILKILLWEVL